MFTRVKLSKLYDEIGNFLKEHGDADIRSIESCCSYDDKTMYMLRLSDLNSFDTTKFVGELRIKYEDFPSTEDEYKVVDIGNSVLYSTHGSLKIAHVYHPIINLAVSDTMRSILIYTGENKKLVYINIVLYCIVLYIMRY